MKYKHWWMGIALLAFILFLIYRDVEDLIMEGTAIIMWKLYTDNP